MTKEQNLLLGLAVGDAFGIAYETMSRHEIPLVFDFTKYQKQPKEGWGNEAGEYTDDTQMSLAIAELLLSGKLLTKESFADYFVNAYKRDERNGYGKGLRIVLPEVSDGKGLIAKLKTDSIRNGAAMRATPLGVLKNPRLVIEAAITNASVTHDTPKGKASAVCMALASHYLLHELGPMSGLFEYCLELSSGIDSESTEYWARVRDMNEFDPVLLFGEVDKDFGIPCDGMRTAGAVMYLVTKYPDTVSVLKEAVLLGGDTDSVAALATGLKAIHCGLDTLPEFLLQDLENGAYGRDYLTRLGERLTEKRSVERMNPR
jgi:ADP-ribosylglycohydrolase